MYVTFNESSITVAETVNGAVAITEEDGVRKATVVPDDGYMVDTVTVDGEEVELAEDGTYTFAEGDHTIAVTFKPFVNEYVITATVGEGGTITPAGEVVVTEGANQTFTIAANAGYIVEYVEVDGVSVAVDGNTYTFTEVYGNHEIYVSFAAVPAYTITASAGANGMIDPAGDVTAYEGTNAVFTFIPDAEYKVASVTVDGEELGTLTSYEFENIVGEHTIHVMFEEISPDYTITVTAGENGTISPEGAFVVSGGSDQLFTITPDAGYKVSNLLVNGKSVKGEIVANTYTLANIEQDTTVDVTFKKVEVKDDGCFISSSAGGMSLGSVHRIPAAAAFLLLAVLAGICVRRR
jgi:hypothetical protein